jgi:hypothetical protein
MISADWGNLLPIKQERKDKKTRPDATSRVFACAQYCRAGCIA